MSEIYILFSFSFLIPGGQGEISLISIYVINTEGNILEESSLWSKMLPVACCSQALLSGECHQDGDIDEDGAEEDDTECYGQHNW